MSLKIYILPFIIISFLGPVNTSAQKQNHWQVIEHDGLEREFLIHLPEGYDPTQSYPLVLALHGGGGTAKHFNRSTRRRFNELSDEAGFILVYPQGIKKSWNDNHHRDTLGYARKHKIDDVGFIMKMIGFMEHQYAVDSEHIFSCGISNGGLMSLTLVLKIPDKIKAIGMVASNFSEAHHIEMENASPFSLLMIHGDEDPLFPYASGEISVFKQKRGRVLGVDKSIATMIALNGNSPKPIRTEIQNTHKKDNCTAFHLQYPNTTHPNRQVELIVVKGGGHTWPGGTQYLPKGLIGRTSRDFNACDALWEFFSSTIN